MSLRAHLLASMARLGKKMYAFKKLDVYLLRKQMEDGLKIFNRPRKDVQMEVGELGGIPCTTFTPHQAASGRVIFWLHGGGYISCSAHAYRGLISKIAHHTQTKVYAPDYRLAPEHPLPAGAEDCVVAYRALRDLEPDAKIIIGGDSAGGGLTLLTIQALQESGEPVPTAAFTISAHADMSSSGASWESNRKRDAMMSRKEMDVLAAGAIGDASPNDPRVSAFHGSFEGFPPTLMMVGGYEALLDDSVRIVEKINAAGGAAKLHIAPKMQHDWPMMPIPEAKPAFRMIAEFVDAQTQ